MKYKFNRECFMKNAPSNIKTRLKYLLNDIENLEVDFSEGDYGSFKVDLYGVTNELYPVYKEWCITEEQLKII